MGREELLQDELNRNKATIEIVRLLGVNEGFETIVSEAFRMMGEYLSVTNIHLLKLRSDRKGFALIAEWMSGDVVSVADAVNGENTLEYCSYCCDTASMRVINSGEIPETFRYFSDMAGVQACVVIPLRINGVAEMLINVCHNADDYRWSESAIQFLSAAGQIIQSILIFREISKSES